MGTVAPRTVSGVPVPLLVSIVLGVVHTTGVLWYGYATGVFALREFTLFQWTWAITGLFLMAAVPAVFLLRYRVVLPVAGFVALLAWLASVEWLGVGDGPVGAYVTLAPVFAVALLVIAGVEFASRTFLSFLPRPVVA